MYFSFELFLWSILDILSCNFFIVKSGIFTVLFSFVSSFLFSIGCVFVTGSFAFSVFTGSFFFTPYAIASSSSARIVLNFCL